MGQASNCEVCFQQPAYVHPECHGKVLCRACAARAHDVSAASSSLSARLMEWGKEEEWSGVPVGVMIEAAADAMKDFEAHLLSGRPLAEGPRLLAAEVEQGELVLTLGTSQKQVWRETFGTWESHHPRVPFMHAMSTARTLGDLMTVYYWDRENDKFADRTCWSTDEEVCGEFNHAVRQVRGGVPRWCVTAEAPAGDSLDSAFEPLLEAVASAGLYPGSIRKDQSRRSVSIEAIGVLTGSRREIIEYLLARKGFAVTDGVTISEGRIDRRSSEP